MSLPASADNTRLAFISFGKSAGFIVVFFEGKNLLTSPIQNVSSVTDALNKISKSIKDSKILILGLTYKRDVDDVRESPSLELIELLRNKGAKVDYNDSYVPMTRKMRHYDLKMSSIPLTEKNLKKYDCVVISTDHSSYDYGFIAKHSRLVVDTRNAMKGVSGSARGNIIKA